MGLVKRNNSKFWYAQFQINGRVYIQSTKTADKKLAEQIEVKLKSEILHGQSFGIKESIKVHLWIEKFLKAKQTLAIYQHYRRYGLIVKRIFGPDVHLDKITVRDVERFRQQLELKQLKPATVSHHIAFLKAALNYARKAGYNVPDIYIQSVRQSPHRLRYLNAEEERRLLESLNPYREIKTQPPYVDRSDHFNRSLHDQYDFVVTLLDTGARHSEITVLEWSAIDLEARTIRLWRPKVRNQSILYMSERLFQVLSRRHEDRNPDIPYIFHTKDGRPKAYCSTTARKIFNRVGLEDCSFHTLRHTLASKLVQNGMNLYEVKEILGHTDIKTTMRYAHLERADVSRRAVMVLNSKNISINDA